MPIAWSDEPHWAFRPIQRPVVPQVRHDEVHDPIDSFIVAELAKRGQSLAPEADRRTLVRRVTLDLTGVPPTVDEVEAFVSDTSAAAYSVIVDRLLASPRFGERWGRHWLDVARYADSEGYESDHLRPHAWRYRDYVVRSFNADKPFDRFLKEQIAGDELTPYSDEHLIATGFLAAARLSSNEEDRARQLNDVLVDIVNTTAATFLGLTVQCAQCHAHKFDPIMARDYYRLQGFFAKGMANNLALKDPDLWKAYEAQRPPEYEPAKRLLRVLTDTARARLAADARAKMSPEQRQALDTPIDERSDEQERLARAAELMLQFTGAQVERAVRDEDRALYAELKKKVEAIEKRIAEPPQTFGFYSPATSPHRVAVLPMKGFYPPEYRPDELRRTRSHLLEGGDVHRRGPAVDTGWPAVFGPTNGTTRRDLADWLTRPDHPLTARVIVNRLWQYHFGRGLVETPNDFGTRGARPTHPELLDWLAAELIRSGWSLKHIHRLIVTSATYCRAAGRGDGFGSWRIRRLESEAIRDSMLAISGELDGRVGGAPDADEAKSGRRTVYLLQKRQKALIIQAVFDGPAAATESCPERAVTTSPLQALYLLNHDFTMQRAKAMAERVRRVAGDDRGRQIEIAWRLAVTRSPVERERRAAERFLADDDLALLCQTLLNLNEVLYLE